MVENCHWGSKTPYKPTATWCPWNFYRTSGDVKAVFSSVIGNLHSTAQYAQANLSYPGCWAYADMLEVGCANGPHGAGDPGLSAAEARTHFGAWAIVSSPLTLSHDVKNQSIMDLIWDVISNKEVIAVSQCYAGHSGSMFKQSTEAIVLSDVNTALQEKDMTAYEKASVGPLVAGAWEYYYKPMETQGTKTAVLMINNSDGASDLILTFSDIPGLMCGGSTTMKCAVRDIWNHKDLGSFLGSITIQGISPHDSAFLVVVPAS